MAKIPEKSPAIVLPGYNSNLLRAILGLKVAETSLRKLKENEVLIRMEAAPCNPSDIAFIRGGYAVVRELPAIPGFEGTGTVVDTGIRATKLQGKRVSAFVQDTTAGTWAEYFIAPAKDCMMILDGMETQQAACLTINPFTAWALVEHAVKHNANSIVQNAAGGQVASFIRIFAAEHGIDVINIVRKPEHVKELKSAGVQHVLNATDTSFLADFRELAKQLEPAFAMDAAGGEMTGQLLSAMPDHSEVILYGGLAGSTLSGIDPFDFIFRNKKLTGFNLSDWRKNKCQVEFEDIGKKIQQMFVEKKLITRIQGTYKFSEVTEGLKTYIKSMSAGKILFTP